MEKSKSASKKKDLKNTLTAKITEVVDSIDHKTTKDSKKVKKAIQEASKIISKALAKGSKTSSAKEKKVVKTSKPLAKSRSLIIPKGNIKKHAASKPEKVAEVILPNVVAIKTAKIAEKKTEIASGKTTKPSPSRSSKTKTKK